LEKACHGDRQSAADYEWMILELYDQATREFSGGELGRYLRRRPVPNEEFIYSRIGELRGKRMLSGAQSQSPTAQRVSRSTGRDLLGSLRARVRRLILTPLIGSSGLQALEVGGFRLSSGQVTYRMYDRFSLEQLFLNAGLSNVSVKTPTASAYALWKNVNLDVSPQGEPARPHVLIMEGMRPS
jgi:hypothetical protein